MRVFQAQHRLKMLMKSSSHHKPFIIVINFLLHTFRPGLLHILHIFTWRYDCGQAHCLHHCPTKRIMKTKLLLVQLQELPVFGYFSIHLMQAHLIRWRTFGSWWDCRVKSMDELGIKGNISNDSGKLQNCNGLESNLCTHTHTHTCVAYRS